MILVHIVRRCWHISEQLITLYFTQTSQTFFYRHRKTTQAKGDKTSRHYGRYSLIQVTVNETSLKMVKHDRLGKSQIHLSSLTQGMWHQIFAIMTQTGRVNCLCGGRVGWVCLCRTGHLTQYSRQMVVVDVRRTVNTIQM